MERRIRRDKTPEGAKIHPGIEIPSEYNLGPAMKRLSERKQAFVVAMIEFGGNNYTRAARAAGYLDTPGSHSIVVTAHKLAHDEYIQAAIKEEGQKRLNASTIMAVKTLLDIADDVTAEKKDRLKAAEMILNRTGLHATSEHKVAVTHKDETSDEMIKQIRQLSKNLGIDPKKLLGGVVVDAEFEEVPVASSDDDPDDIFRTD